MSYLDNRGFVSTDNSSTATLGVGLTFTGTAEDVSAFPSVTCTVLTDQDGTLFMEFSPDGTNWDVSIIFDTNANKPEFHRLTITRQYFRARFTNTSGSAQTFFRLQTLYGLQTQLNSPINGEVQDDADALITRPIDFNYLVSDNKYQNHSTIEKAGINFDIDTGTTVAAPEDIWFGGGVYTGFPTGSPENLMFVSTSASDTGTVYFYYLATSSSTEYVEGSVVLNGLTPVNTGISVYRCNYAYYENGSSGVNVGDISAYHQTTTSNIFLYIVAGYGQSFCSAYTVPANATVFIDRVTAGIEKGAAAAVDCFFYQRAFGESHRLRIPFTVSSNSFFFDDLDYIFRFEGGMDIMIRATNTTANNTELVVSYRMMQVKNQ